MLKWNADSLLVSHRNSFHLRRRHFLGATLAAGALGAARVKAAPAALPDIKSVPEALKGSGEVRVVGYGGAMQDAQRRAYFDLFEQLCGIKVRAIPGPTWRALQLPSTEGPEAQLTAKASR